MTWLLSTSCISPGSPHALKCDWSASSHEVWDSDMHSECKAMWILSASLARGSFCTMPTSFLVSGSTQIPCENAHRIPLRMTAWSRLRTQARCCRNQSPCWTACTHIQVLPWCIQGLCLSAFWSSIRKHSDSIWECTQGPCRKAYRINARRNS